MGTGSLSLWGERRCGVRTRLGIELGTGLGLKLQKFWAQRDISMGIGKMRGSGHRIGTDDGENLRKCWAQRHEEHGDRNEREVLGTGKAQEMLEKRKVLGTEQSSLWGQR